MQQEKPHPTGWKPYFKPPVSHLDTELFLAFFKNVGFFFQFII